MILYGLSDHKYNSQVVAVNSYFVVFINRISRNCPKERPLWIVFTLQVYSDWRDHDIAIVIAIGNYTRDVYTGS